MWARRVREGVRRVEWKSGGWGRGFGGLVVVIGTSYCEVSKKNTHQ